MYDSGMSKEETQKQANIGLHSTNDFTSQSVRLYFDTINE